MGRNRGGDFDDFVRQSSSTLLRTAVLLTGSVSDGQDLLQDVLVRVFVAWPSIDDPHAYTRKALVRAAQNRWRWRRRHPETDLAGREPASADLAEDLANRDHMLDALRCLPAGQRAVVVLRHYEGLSEREIAAVLNCSPGTVKSQASRGLAGLRSLLAQSVDTASTTKRGGAR